MLDEPQKWGQTEYIVYMPPLIFLGKQLVVPLIPVLPLYLGQIGGLSSCLSETSHEGLVISGQMSPTFRSIGVSVRSAQGKNIISDIGPSGN